MRIEKGTAGPINCRIGRRLYDFKQLLCSVHKPLLLPKLLTTVKTVLFYITISSNTISKITYWDCVGAISSDSPFKALNFCSFYVKTAIENNRSLTE